MNVDICKLHAIEYQERHLGWNKKRLRPPGRPHQAYTHGSPYVCTYIYIYVYIEHIYTYMLHKKKYINYTENRGSRPPMKNTDLTGKYYVEVTFSWKLWNDPTDSTVILPVALCFKHARKQRFWHRTLAYKSCINMYTFSQQIDFSKTWANRSHTLRQYFAPYQTIPSAI